MTTARQPGLSTAVWVDGFDPAVHVPQMAAAGFKAIELNIYLGSGHFDPSPDHVATLKQAIGDHDMAVWSIHSRDVGDLASPDRAVVDKQLDELRYCLDLADELAADVIVSHALFPQDRAIDRTDADFQLVDILGELAPDVSPRRARIAFENTTTTHPGECAIDVLRRLIGQPRDAFGFVLDPGHANIAGDLETIVYGHGQRLITTHLNDNLGDADAHLVPGDGTVNWSSVVQMVDETPYEGTIMYEVRDAGADRSDVMQRTLAAHHRLFGQQAG